MTVTLQQLAEAFGHKGPIEVKRENRPSNVEEVKSYMAGKVGQWLNQNSHLDRDEASEKTLAVIELLFQNWMYDDIMLHGSFDKDSAHFWADQFYNLMAWHYQESDSQNLGNSVLTRWVAPDLTK